MTLKGIDISSAQAGMDVTKVSADFVIIKATQGTHYVNPFCDVHYQQAKKAGKLRGVYHYANGGNPINEADYFLKNIQGYVKDALLALDWERDLGGGYKNPVFGTAGAPTWIKTWCDYVFSKTGVRPLVYVQATALNDVMGIGDYGLWIAQYANYDITYYQEHPWNEGSYSCAIRQYAGSGGRVQGYTGEVDLDIAYMDKTAWMKYANPSGSAAKPTPAPTPAPQPAASPATAGFAVGDTVKPIQLVDYNGNRLASYHDTYTVSEINGDRAVLTAGGQVWAALRTSNLSKVGGGSAPAASTNSQIHVGDTVRVTNAVTYGGQSFKCWYDTYTVMELNGDRAVIGVNGQVTAAINVCNITKA